MKIKEIEINETSQFGVWLGQYRRIVIWGTGHWAEQLVTVLVELGRIELVQYFVDSNEERQKLSYHGKPVYAPWHLQNQDYDLVLLAVCNWEPLYVQAVKEYGVPHKCLENIYFYQHHLLMRHYSGLPGLRREQLSILTALKNRPMSFGCNYIGADGYNSYDVDVVYDENCGLFYALYEGKRMYMSCKFDTAEKVVSYVRVLAREQDEESPHCYLTDDFNVRKGDVVLDAGAAEGFFSLAVVEGAAHIYLVEADEDWLEPLRRTFAPYGDKITLIHGFLSDRCEGIHTTLDKIMQDRHLDFLKMDIEGAEIAALYGGRQTLAGKEVRMAICAYHKTGDYGEIREMLREYGYQVKIRPGYMCYAPSTIEEQIRSWYAPRLVHGVVCAECDARPRLLLFGAGRHGKIVYESIRHDKCHLSGVADNSPSKRGQIFYSFEIQPLAEAVQNSFDYVVLTSATYAHEMRQECLEQGVDEGKIISYWENEQTFDFLDQSAALQHCNALLSLRLENLPYELGTRPVPEIKPAMELLTKLIYERKSLSRFGDGEFSLILMEARPWFQVVDHNLSRRLAEVLHSHDDRIVIAISDNFGNLDRFTDSAANAIRRYMADGMRKRITDLLEEGRIYYDAYVSRPYIISKDKIFATCIFELFKKLFVERRILIVEGMDGRFGWNNDLLSGATEVKRIRCPAFDAFASYDKILDTIHAQANMDNLILVSLGPTATILAYDLAMMGYQAIDIGQLDNEYDWYRAGAITRQPVGGKCVAEVSYAHTSEVEPEFGYMKQVLATVS